MGKTLAKYYNNVVPIAISYVLITADTVRSNREKRGLGFNSQNIPILDFDLGIPPSAAGDYQCIAGNMFGTVTENFTVVVLSE